MTTTIASQRLVSPRPSEDAAAPSVVEHFAATTAPVWPAWLLSATVCVWFAWSSLPFVYLATWIGVYLVFTVARIEVFRRYARLPLAQRVRDEVLWRQRFIVLMLAYGSLQVLLIAPAIPFAPVERAMLLTFMIFFSCALVSSIMPLSKENLRGYLPLTLGSVAVAWLLAPVSYGWAIAVGLIGCMMAFYKTGLTRLAAIEQTHRLSLKLADSNALLAQTNVTRARLTMEASHDLRQPVQALTLMADLLRASRNEPTFDARVRDIEICAASLADMLNELMEFSRLDLGGYEPPQQAVAMEEVLHELNAVLASVARSRRLNWRVTALPVYVRSHPWMLRRILLNLATNALKYTRAGSVVIECVEDGDHLDISVRDTGAGIPQAQQSRIFMEFVRIEETHGTEPGMGIGLAFAKRAADALGHQLRVRSTVGIGTEMILRVALTPAPAEAAAQPEPSVMALRSRSLQGLRVLVVENDPMLQRSLVNILESWGVIVEAFASGENMVETPMLPSRRPDVLVVDLHLDGRMNGLDTIRVVREAFPQSHIPAVLLTGDLSREIEEQASAQSVLLAYKPLRPPRLKELLARADANG